MEHYNDDQPDYRPIEHATTLTAPREPIIATRLEQIKRFPGRPQVSQGLCPSCLDSGFVHQMRNGKLAVLMDSNDVIILCDCTHGDDQRKVREKARQDRDKRR